MTLNEKVDNGTNIILESFKLTENDLGTDSMKHIKQVIRQLHKRGFSDEIITKHIYISVENVNAAKAKIDKAKKKV